MAEYIDRKQVEKITWQEPYSHDPINVLTEVREKVRNIPIADVIPLEKIKDSLPASCCFCPSWCRPLV